MKEGNLIYLKKNGGTYAPSIECLSVPRIFGIAGYVSDTGIARMYLYVYIWLYMYIRNLDRYRSCVYMYIFIYIFHIHIKYIY
jgi:hypothetical protein